MLLLRAELPYPLTASLDPRYRRTDDALGWDELCTDLRAVRMPGDHVSMIDPPHVTTLAARLAAALHLVRAERGGPDHAPQIWRHPR
ncbi:hypothetical protein AB0I53_08375 [Saccharopolyspora sp. NPDC050389]|uniref:hypothetical protein n=1 Tax=Saccharopolyspora sp. NPDC050389 TaxID=3155516 RepID=UPI0033C005E3